MTIIMKLSLKRTLIVSLIFATLARAPPPRVIAQSMQVEEAEDNVVGLDPQIADTPETERQTLLRRLQQAPTAEEKQIEPQGEIIHGWQPGASVLVIDGKFRGWPGKLRKWFEEEGKWGVELFEELTSGNSEPAGRIRALQTALRLLRLSELMPAEECKEKDPSAIHDDQCDPKVVTESCMPKAGPNAQAKRMEYAFSHAAPKFQEHEIVQAIELFDRDVVKTSYGTITKVIRAAASLCHYEVNIGGKIILYTNRKREHRIQCVPVPEELPEPLQTQARTPKDKWVNARIISRNVDGTVNIGYHDDTDSDEDDESDSASGSSTWSNNTAECEQFGENWKPEDIREREDYDYLANVSGVWEHAHATHHEDGEYDVTLWRLANGKPFQLDSQFIRRKADIDRYCPGWRAGALEPEDDGSPSGCDYMYQYFGAPDPSWWWNYRRDRYEAEEPTIDPSDIPEKGRPASEDGEARPSTPPDVQLPDPSDAEASSPA